MQHPVVQNVSHRAPHLGRSLQLPGEVRVGEEAAAPPGRAVDRPRGANGERAHASAQRTLVVAFDDQMQVIALH